MCVEKKENSKDNLGIESSWKLIKFAFKQCGLTFVTETIFLTWYVEKFHNISKKNDKKLIWFSDSGIKKLSGHSPQFNPEIFVLKPEIFFLQKCENISIYICDLKT